MTINDIAKASGLSRATVSRVLQNSPKVSEKSRQRVEQIIRETGYQPNQIAQSLAQGYSNIIALIIGNISSIAQVEITKTIQRELYKKGFMTWLCNSDYNIALCDAYLDSAVTNKLAGVFLITADATPQKLQAITKTAMPIVLVNRQESMAACDSILGNDQKAAYQAVEYLASMGHQNIALLSSSRTMITSYNACCGYRAGVIACKLPCREDYIYEADITSYSDALKTRYTFDISRLFTEHPEVTAIICTSNEAATEFYIQCRKEGKQIPRDLSLICLDPVKTEVPSEINFCTFGAEQQALGEAAVKQMLLRIAQRKNPGKNAEQTSNIHIMLEPSYHEGNSVKRMKAQSSDTLCSRY